jgi:geranylgeranyl diphosphate synthase type II
VPAGAAIELVHTFSLVHDDLPAMDDDELRRGRPTNHKVFGEALAILAGDAMTTLAFELLAAAYRPTPALGLALVQELAAAAGPAGMIGGQVMDIAAENQGLSVEQLRDIHRRKTGALIRCACRLGALVAGADDAALAALTRYGERLGLAFQIADDLLDITATPESAGKATGKDAAAGKNTYPALLGEEGARRAARDESAAAIAALEPLGHAATGLRELARLAVDRVK